MLSFRSWKPEDELSDLRANGFAGCPTCARHLCSDCAAQAKLICEVCGTDMVLSQYIQSPTGDWRLPERFRAIEGVEARLAELGRMKTEWDESGAMTPREVESYVQYYTQVITDDPAADDWYSPASSATS